MKLAPKLIDKMEKKLAIAREALSVVQDVADEINDRLSDEMHLFTNGQYDRYYGASADLRMLADDLRDRIMDESPALIKNLRK